MPRKYLSRRSLDGELVSHTCKARDRASEGLESVPAQTPLHFLPSSLPDYHLLFGGNLYVNCTHKIYFIFFQEKSKQFDKSNIFLTSIIYVFQNYNYIMYNFITRSVEKSLVIFLRKHRDSPKNTFIKNTTEHTI